MKDARHSRPTLLYGRGVEPRRAGLPCFPLILVLAILLGSLIVILGALQ